MTAESDRRKVWTPSERAHVLATLEKLSYIREAEVPRDALMDALDKIKLKSLVQDEYVFSQGDLNRSFYIVLSGQIHFCEPANKVRPAVLGSPGPCPSRWPSPPLCLSSPPSPPLCLCLLTAALGAFAHPTLGAFAHSPSTHTLAALDRSARALHARTHGVDAPLRCCAAGHKAAWGGAGGRRLRGAWLHHRQAARGGRACCEALPPARLRRRALPPALLLRAGAQGGALPGGTAGRGRRSAW